MRIGMMVDTYHPYVSGVTHSVALCQRALEAAGHDVFVFTFGPRSVADTDRVLRSPGLPLGLRYGPTEVHLGLRYGREQREMLRSMDVLHVHHPFLSGRLALRYRQVVQPIVFTGHTRYDLHAEAYLPGWMHRPARAALLALLRRFCRRCACAFAPTADAATRLEEWGVRCPIEVVPLGVDLERFRVRGRAARRRAVAAFVGRLGPEKNLRFLLERVAAAAARGLDLDLVVAGDGPDRPSLESYARWLGVDTRVRFTGLVPYDGIPAILRNADFFVTPSLSEVQPLSLLEAMASGLPVLGLRSPAVATIVEDGANGHLADDQRSFDAGLARLVTDRDARAEMGRAAVEISARHSIDHTAANLMRCYSRVVASAQRAATERRGHA